jgi:hypothetical protein
MILKALRSRLFFVLSSVLLLLTPTVALARIGVGVGMGKIVMDKPLKAGGIYDLPMLPVINTGDEKGSYGVSVEFLEGSPQMWPDRSWFQFDPDRFTLEPGQVQQVKMKLTVPTKTKPGEYFCYLEGHPDAKSETGKTTIGVAAATKLYFTVDPANIFQGIYYRFIFLYSRYHPWDTIILSVTLAAIILIVIGKNFKFQISKK